ncbi:MAG: B12-binding domain-containing radical SAM protein [Oscillospiraceae bacterium]|nr:B12-binding domain-containing radical SAM protein [Oscillospiraceae bacterium]
MYIKLVQPKMIKRPMDTDLKLHMAPPLGLLTVANIVRGEHRVVLENENIEQVCYDDKPDIVGISVTVDTLPRAMQIAKRFRQHGAVVVAGGIHVTTAHETIPADAFDVLCIGAAEGTWPDIVRDAQNGCLKKIYRCSGMLCGEDIVSPAYDMIDRSKYLYTSVIHTSRGCPFRCDFCYNSAKSHQFVNRPIPDILREIRAAGTKHIMFIDDNFAGNPQRTKELLRAIMPMKLKWQAAVSINAAKDPELLDMMRESGCRSLFIGFESINPASVQNVHKVQNGTKEYEQAIEAIHARGIMINGSFVFGLDGDTPETFDTTVEWIVRNRIETVTSHILTPYPGTALYDRMQADGRITSHDLSLYNTAHVVFRPLGMTAKELYQGYLGVYKKVYSLKNIFRRLPRCKAQRIPYLLFNLVYRKYGRCTDFLCKCVTYRRMGRLAAAVARYM